MADTKHTPGPWIVDHTEKGLIGKPATRIISDGPVCTQTVAHLMDDAYLNGEGSTIANARLIAAAPELLKALEIAEKWLREFGVHWGSDEGRKIRDAIAKARAA